MPNPAFSPPSVNAELLEIRLFAGAEAAVKSRTIVPFCRIVAPPYVFAPESVSALGELRLIESIRRYEADGLCIDGEDAYYTCWVEALVKLLGQKGCVELQRIAVAEHQIAQRLPANGHTHSHDDDHPHDRTAPSPVSVDVGR